MNVQSLPLQVEKSLPAGARRILVAVSGGVDSVALLYILCRLREGVGLTLVAAHLDHQIRAESGRDAEFVRTLCQAWQVPCEIEKKSVPQLAEDLRQSLEMAGRRARREMLERLAQRYDCELVALAHHRDDQVETFLMRLIRGSGATGLAAMKGCSGVWWRPLLDCSRDEILAYAREHALEWVEDSSNQDPAYLRNRVRHQVLPLLRRLNPNFYERTAALVGQLQADEDFWQQQVAERFPALVISDTDGLRLSRPGLLAVHPAFRSRLIREALSRVRGGLQGIEGGHLVAVDRLLSGSRSQAQLDLPDCWVARRYEVFWVRGLAPAPAADYNEILPVPGRFRLPDGRLLVACYADESKGESPQRIELDAALLELPLRVRTWRPGDRFQPRGMSGSKKLKNYFSDSRIELEDRPRVPLLVAGGRILWLAGYRRSGFAEVVPGCRRILRVELLDQLCPGTKNL